MKLNLPNQLAEADVFVQNPFVIFEFHNFMDDSDYDTLVNEMKSFNEYDSIDPRGMEYGMGGKMLISYNRSNLEQIKLPQFKKLVTELTSRSFFEWFKKTHFPYIKKRHPISILVSKPRNIIIRIVRRISRILHLPLGFYYMEVQTSVIKKGDSLPPHIDDARKRLSLILYLSERELPEKIRTNWGTIFYGLKDGGQEWRETKKANNPSGYNETYLTNKNETTEFLNNYEQIYVAKFRPNVCAGFIKNDISWHSVDEIKFGDDRKVLVINVREEW